MPYRRDFSLDKDLIIDFTEKGFSDKAIGEQLGCSQSAIHYARKRYGIQRKQRYNHSKYDHSEIKEYIDLGYTRDEISAIMGISLPRLHSIASSYGWKITPKQRNKETTALIYSLISEGLTNSEIAEKVSRTVRNIATHRANYNRSR